MLWTLQRVYLGTPNEKYARAARRSTARELVHAGAARASSSSSSASTRTRSSTCINPSLAAPERDREGRRRARGVALALSAWTSATVESLAVHRARADPDRRPRSLIFARRPRRRGRRSSSARSRSSACAGALVASIGLRLPFSDRWLVQGLFGWGAGLALQPHDRARRLRRLLQAASSACPRSATVWMSLGSHEVRDQRRGRVLRAPARERRSACSSWRRRRTC